MRFLHIFLIFEEFKLSIFIIWIISIVFNKLLYIIVYFINYIICICSSMKKEWNILQYENL